MKQEQNKFQCKSFINSFLHNFSHLTECNNLHFLQYNTYYINLLCPYFKEWIHCYQIDVSNNSMKTEFIINNSQKIDLTSVITSLNIPFSQVPVSYTWSPLTPMETECTCCICIEMRRKIWQSCTAECLFVWACDREFNIIRAILTAWRQLITSAYLKRKWALSTVK